MCKTGKTETSVLVLTIILLENLLHTFFFFFLLMGVACVELSHFIFSSTHPPIPDKGRKILLTIRECRLVELHSYFVYYKSKSPYWRCSGKPGTVHKMCILLTLLSSGKTQSTEISWVLFCLLPGRKMKFLSLDVPQADVWPTPLPSHWY